MTSTLTAQPNAEQRAALRRIAAFRKRFGEGHFYLACHAALPLALTPDLLYCLWVNFQQDSHQELLDIPWIAVSDLILSNLCEEVGHELYEMDTPTRKELLKQLQNDSRFGLERTRELADFMMAYVEQQLDSADLDRRDFAEAQRWGALAYKNPHEAAHGIALSIAQLGLNDKTEWMRMEALLNSLAEPLSAFQLLLDYSRSMAEFARGNSVAAITQMTKVADASKQLRVEGVNLPIPDVVVVKLPIGVAQNALPMSSPKARRLPITISVGMVVSLVILIGSQYVRRSPTSQPTPASSAIPTSQAQVSRSSMPIPRPSEKTALPTSSPASPQATKTSQVLPANIQGIVASQPGKTLASSPTAGPSDSSSGSNFQSSVPLLIPPIQLLNPAQPSPTQSPPVSVQPSSNNTSSPSLPVTKITKINVFGSTIFSSKDFDSIIQPLENKLVTLEELRSAADAITQLYLNRGYITSRAILSEPTVVNGVAQIIVIEGSLRSITIEGNQNVPSSYILQVMQKGTSTPLNEDSLRTQLQLLHTDPKFTGVGAELRPSGYAGQSILIIRVTEANSSKRPSSVNDFPSADQIREPPGVSHGAGSQ